MALPMTYFLSDVDGALCVAARSADWAEPRYIVTHFPTIRTTASFCRRWEINKAELRESVEVRQNMPGDYTIVVRKSGFEFYIGTKNNLGLTDGAKTKAVATTFEPVPLPRVGKGTKLEWQSGRWHDPPPRGKVRIVEV